MSYSKSSLQWQVFRAWMLLSTLMAGSGPLFADHHLSSIATDAQLNETLTDDLPLGVVKYFKFTVPEAGTVVAYTQGTLNTTGRILNEQDHVYASANDGATGSNFLINVHLVPGTFFVEISSAVRTESGPFNLVIEFTSDTASQQDPATDMDTFRATLAREVSLLNPVYREGGQDTLSDARLNAGASLTSSLSPATTFAENDEILISGAVTPQNADRGQAANIYVVIRTFLPQGGQTWKYRNASGVFVDWNGAIADLEPAFARTSLGNEEIVEVFSGKLQIASHRIFLGYRLSAAGPLHYNQSGLRIDVE
jgi:hypothetical protein